MRFRWVVGAGGGGVRWGSEEGRVWLGAYWGDGGGRVGGLIRLSCIVYLIAKGETGWLGTM